MGISIVVFFGIVMGAVIVSAVIGLILGIKHSRRNVVGFLIENSDTPIDDVIKKDFSLDFEE